MFTIAIIAGLGAVALLGYMVYNKITIGTWED